MKVNPGSEKPCGFDVSKREVAFFKNNYPLHHMVLMELVERGEARIIEEPGGSA